MKTAKEIILSKITDQIYAINEQYSGEVRNARYQNKNNNCLMSDELWRDFFEIYEKIDISFEEIIECGEKFNYWSYSFLDTLFSQDEKAWFDNKQYYIDKMLDIMKNNEYLFQKVIKIMLNNIRLNYDNPVNEDLIIGFRKIIKLGRDVGYLKNVNQDFFNTNEDKFKKIIEEEGVFSYDVGEDVLIEYLKKPVEKNKTKDHRNEKFVSTYREQLLKIVKNNNEVIKRFDADFLKEILNYSSSQDSELIKIIFSNNDVIEKCDVFFTQSYFEKMENILKEQMMGFICSLVENNNFMNKIEFGSSYSNGFKFSYLLTFLFENKNKQNNWGVTQDNFIFLMDKIKSKINENKEYLITMSCVLFLQLCDKLTEKEKNEIKEEYKNFIANYFTGPKTQGYYERVAYNTNDYKTLVKIINLLDLKKDNEIKEIIKGKVEAGFCTNDCEKLINNIILLDDLDFLIGLKNSHKYNLLSYEYNDLPGFFYVFKSAKNKNEENNIRNKLLSKDNFKIMLEKTRIDKIWESLTIDEKNKLIYNISDDIKLFEKTFFIAKQHKKFLIKENKDILTLIDKTFFKNTMDKKLPKIKDSSEMIKKI